MADVTARSLQYEYKAVSMFVEKLNTDTKKERYVSVAAFNTHLCYQVKLTSYLFLTSVYSLLASNHAS